MPSSNSQSTPTALQTWLQDAKQHPAIAGFGGLAAVGFIVMLASGLGTPTGDLQQARYALLAGTAGFVATALGALLGGGLRKLTSVAEDSMLGFAAGMMLAASSFSLILPALTAARDMTGSGPLSALTVAAGLALGAALMLGIDHFTPHEHAQTGPCGPAAARVERVWLFFFAITLHNFPEGMALGVSFAQGDLSTGLPLTAAIAIQDFPEGLAVVMALRAAGIGVMRAVLLAVASGVTEPLGALLGVSLAGGFALAYPIGLGLAAGAMLFVVSHEVIPETHRNGHQTPATIGLMTGFALMMVLDTALG